MRVGFLALTDSAPLVAAQELGFFGSSGLSVRLTREVGWATVYSKLLQGELDAAQAPAAMLWSAHLGLHGPAFSACTAMILSQHGSAITLSTALRRQGVTDAPSLRAEAARRRGERRLTFGVVHLFSAHHLFLRSWLKAARLEPGRDVRIAVVPAAQMFPSLAAGNIDGYCVGEPWNSLAIRAQIGWCPAVSALFKPGQVEKVLIVRTEFAERHAKRHAALISALSSACEWCDNAENRLELAQMLASQKYLDLPSDLIAPALAGRFDHGGNAEDVPDFHVFHRLDANIPTVEKAAAIQQELVSAGLLPMSAAMCDLPGQLFREDLYHAAVRPGQTVS
jgi:ABC-type nitrate/sulfonate/bicarbonate transport system substrate-binding protein